MRNEDRIRSGKGLINDVKKNLLSICLQAFKTEPLELLAETPIQAMAVNPDYVDIKDLPALFAWVDGIKPSSHSIGQNYTFKRTELIEFHAKIQYIRPYISSEDDSDSLDQVGWELFEYIDKNRNLNDIVKMETLIPELTTLPMIRNVQGKLQPVSNVNMRLVFTVIRRKQLASRRDEIKKYL